MLTCVAKIRRKIAVLIVRYESEEATRRIVGLAFSIRLAPSKRTIAA